MPSPPPLPPHTPPPPATSQSTRTGLGSTRTTSYYPIEPANSSNRLDSPPSSYRYPSRLIRPHNPSFVSTIGGRTSPEQTQQVGSTSSFDSFASGSRLAPQTSLSDVPVGGLQVSSPLSGVTRVRKDNPFYRPEHEIKRRRMEPGWDEGGQEVLTQNRRRSTSEAVSDPEGSSDDDDEEASLRPSGGGESLLVPYGQSFEVKKKRTRVLPTAHQSAELNKLLDETAFPSTARREELGRRIGLSARKVQASNIEPVWFQNRRQKARRSKDDPLQLTKQRGRPGPRTGDDETEGPTSPIVSPVSPQRTLRHALPSISRARPSWEGPVPTRGSSSTWSPQSEGSHVLVEPPSRNPDEGPISRDPVKTEESNTLVHRSVRPTTRSRRSIDLRPRQATPPLLQELISLPMTPPPPSSRRLSHDLPRSPDIYPPPPSSYHPYPTRGRRSPSRRLSVPVPSNPVIYAASSHREDSLRLPPLHLPESPRSRLRSPARGLLLATSTSARSPPRLEDRGPMSPLYPGEATSLSGWASTSLSGRATEVTSVPRALPAPFTLEPSPVWDPFAAFDPRRLSWGSLSSLSRSTSGSRRFTGGATPSIPPRRPSTES